MKKIKVLIADDHQLVRLAITKLLAETDNFQVVAAVKCGKEAVRVATIEKPDLVVMDIEMPGIGGLEATKKILHHLPETKIIILTQFEQAIFFQQALAAGAVGYITKDVPHRLLFDCLDKAMAGKTYLTPSMAQKIALKNVSGEESPLDKLTQRELQVALKIISGLDVYQIADALYITHKSVNTIRYMIFKKMNISNDVQLVLSFMQFGLIDTPASFLHSTSSLV